MHSLHTQGSIWNNIGCDTFKWNQCKQQLGLCAVLWFENSRFLQTKKLIWRELGPQRLFWSALFNEQTMRKYFDIDHSLARKRRDSLAIVVLVKAKPVNNLDTADTFRWHNFKLDTLRFRIGNA